MVRNFVDAVLDGKALIAPAEEGIRSVELANAMLLSSFTDTTVALPMDASAFEHLLSERIARSGPKKDIRLSDPNLEDFAKSFRP